MLIGERIKEIRLLRNYTQKYIAGELGMSHANYGKIENGYISINKDRLKKVASLFGTTIEEITAGNPDCSKYVTV